MPLADLPAGVWFEAPRGRYRVRLYRHQRYWVSYYKSRDEAIEAHSRLKARIAELKPDEPLPTVAPTFRSMARILKDRGPNTD